MKRFFSKILSIPSPLVGLGLMLASSGLDGIYMSLWMPGPLSWLGFVLNTVADFADMKLAYEFGKLQRKRDKSKVHLSVILLGGELVAIFYSWFFSWRQLLRVLHTVEPAHYTIIAPIAAGFIPLLLGFLGFAEALNEMNKDLLKSEPESTVSIQKPAISVQKPTTPAPQSPRRRASRDEWRKLYPQLSEPLVQVDGDHVNDILYLHGFTRLPLSTARDWAKEAVTVKGNGGSHHHEKV